MGFDLWVFGALERLRFPLLDRFLHLCTLLGDTAIIWIIIAVALLLSARTRKVGVSVGIALLFSAVVSNLLLKNWIARPRPFDALPDLNVIALTSLPHGLSFPSGHASASFAASVAILMHMKSGTISRPASITCVILAVLISFSRVYLHVHYATDVLGGAAVGTLCGVAAAWVAKRVFRESRTAR